MTCTFIPPYLLDHLVSAAAGSAAAASGQSTLQVDQQLRGRRHRPTLAPLAPPALRADAAAPRRVIHSAGGTETLPGTPLRSDDDPESGDVAVDEAFTYAGQVWDLFAEVFERASVDGQGTTLTVTVHYGQDYDNAFWDGSQLVFGDGDGEVFERFTKPADVMAHEFTHGVTQFSAGLTYQGQSGALNESVSDVFASLTKQRVLGQDVSDADWLIGEGLFRPGVNARALRSMLEPGTAYDDPRLGRDPQVGSMADYVETEEDNGGVHLNSGIPNRAFALAAVAIGGSSWEKAGRVWYDTLTGGAVGADADFVAFAAATVASAERLFANDASVAQAVRTGWTEVGVLTAPDGPTPADPADAGDAGDPGDAGDAGDPGDPGDAGDAGDPRPVDAVPTAPAPAPGPGVPVGDVRTVAVRRSGGFTGGTRSAELDLDGDPQGPQVRQLLQQADLRLVASTPPAPDRFVYTVAVGEWELTLPEQDLTPELDQVVRIVLGGSRGVQLG